MYKLLRLLHWGHLKWIGFTSAAVKPLRGQVLSGDGPTERFYNMALGSETPRPLMTDAFTSGALSVRTNRWL